MGLFHACVSSLIIMPAAVSAREKSGFWKKSFVGVKDAADARETTGKPLQARAAAGPVAKDLDLRGVGGEGQQPGAAGRGTGLLGERRQVRERP